MRLYAIEFVIDRDERGAHLVWGRLVSRAHRGLDTKDDLVHQIIDAGKQEVSGILLLRGALIPQIEAIGAHHAVIEKGKASFHSMGHRYTVPLRGEQIIGQENGDFRVLSPGKRIPRHEIRRQSSAEALLQSCLLVYEFLHLRREKSLELGGIFPTNQ